MPPSGEKAQPCRGSEDGKGAERRSESCQAIESRAEWREMCLERKGGTQQWASGLRSGVCILFWVGKDTNSRALVEDLSHVLKRSL